MVGVTDGVTEMEVVTDILTEGVTDIVGVTDGVTEMEGVTETLGVGVGVTHDRVSPFAVCLLSSLLKFPLNEGEL